MHLVEEKDATIGLLDQSLAVMVGSGIGSFDYAKEMSHQQLRIACIISTVETNKRRIFG